MDIVNYLVENALILIPVLNVIGAIIKGIEKIPDKYIPLILLPIGILGAMGIIGFSVNAAIQGVLVTGAAVFGNQVVKQLKNK
ncbi:MAG: phage holin family protein [Oscillospiraceae bacterium]